MIEIYKNSADRNVFIDVPLTAVSGTLDAEVYEGETLVYTAEVVTYNNGRYSFPLPFNLVQNDRELSVRWEFDYIEGGITYTYSESQNISIVTPLLPLSIVASIVEKSVTDPDVVDIERATRYIVQSHTGQVFGKFVGKKTVVGNGEVFVKLPMRLLRLSKLNDSEYWVPNLILSKDGWFLKNKDWGVPPLKADYDGWHYLKNGVIEGSPFGKRRGWAENAVYTLEGEWGWDSVPGAVQEAARLLINDYACNDSLYRDRYIQAVSAVDWKIQFNSGAFLNTGNVRADQLLKDYVLYHGWAVV